MPSALVSSHALAYAALFIGERLFPYHAAGFVLVAGGAILGCLKTGPVLSSQASTNT